MSLHNNDIGQVLGCIEVQERMPDVTLKVTHQVPEDTAQVDAIEMALREMLAEKELLPPSDSADLAGYPGLTPQN